MDVSSASENQPFTSRSKSTVNKEDSTKSRKPFRPGFRTILANGGILIFAPLFFTTLLVVLIVRNRVDPRGTTDPLFSPQGNTTARGELYLDFRDGKINANTVASWTATVSSKLSGFAMALLSFPAAKTHWARRYGNPKSVTPYQFALSLHILAGGGIGALWTWSSYTLRKRAARPPQGTVLKMLAGGAFTMFGLSVLVFITESWFQATTEPRALVQTRPYDPAVANAGFGLIPRCLQGNNTFYDTKAKWEITNCITTANGSWSLDSNITVETHHVMENVSSSSQVHVFKHENQDYAYLKPIYLHDSNIDYSATTFALKTQCELKTQECKVKDHYTDHESFPWFQCPFNFNNGSRAVLYDEWAYFNDKSLESTSCEIDNRESTGTMWGVQNPYYMAMRHQAKAGPAPLSGTPDVLPLKFGDFYILLCNATVYDVRLSLVNDNLAINQLTLSNVSVTNLVQGTEQYINFARHKLKEASTLALLSHTREELASRVALEYSKMALVVASQGFERQPALAAQLRDSPRAVSVIKLAPLVAFVVSNLLLSVLGVVLAAVAIQIVWTDGSHEGTEGIGGSPICKVQRRLDVFGLMAQLFEPETSLRTDDRAEMLFSENRSDSKEGMEEVKRVVVESCFSGDVAFGVSS
ncbi:hypothetical protein P154DRAFT_610961 [Amniculicola lignicola CBS 123094]|uniref:Uncharacterized protein n=1 Tax=Amniculicola lignicola CBS 123094 TaxID=1392246 RepID=A0A6A5WCZ0_9PLEO|nr:hypothetical protein P154DRAFT_610961 [Amniculicola lignicola CBS 123094]